MILSRFNYQEKLQIKKEKEKQEIDFDFFHVGDIMILVTCWDFVHVDKFLNVGDEIQILMFSVEQFWPQRRPNLSTESKIVTDIFLLVAFVNKIDAWNRLMLQGDKRYYLCD